MVRKGNWKLHHYFEDDDYELYNLQADPGERTNLAETETAIRDQLISLLDAWRNDSDAPVPIQRNPLYDAQFEINLIKESLDE